MEERKGVFTPDQEQLLDDLKEWDNPLVEAADGMAIQVADNQILERIKNKFEAKHPGSTDLIYELTDGIMSIVEAAVKTKASK
jgi:hypothetical protein